MSDQGANIPHCPRPAQVARIQEQGDARLHLRLRAEVQRRIIPDPLRVGIVDPCPLRQPFDGGRNAQPLRPQLRSEEHTSELQSLMRTSYAVFCLKKKNKQLEYYM